MSRQRSLSICVGMLVLGLLPAVSNAAPAMPMDGDLAMARQLESDGKWGDACARYSDLLLKHRDQPELKDRFLHCRRQYHRTYRLTDDDFVNQLKSPAFKQLDAVKFYRYAVRKLQEFYVDSDRALTNRLFQEGLKELDLDLQDPAFWNIYLRDSGVGAIEVQEFRSHLRQKWGEAKVDSLPEAEEQIRAVAKEAFQRLKLSGKVVFVEFACGACNGLDEYTFYLTEGYLMSLREGKSITDVGLLEHGIGYINLVNFQDSTMEELETALAILDQAGMKVLLLDLRDNPGGSLDVAVQVAERFLPAGKKIGSTAGKVTRTFRSQNPNPKPMDKPVFLMIDGGTVSAAEFLAGALKAHKRAELVGRTTFGKNSIQKTVKVDQTLKGAICITWAHFYLPKPHDFAKQGGIAPTIPADPDMDMEEDQQLEVAREKARQLLPSLPQ